MNRVLAMMFKEWKICIDTPLGYVIAVAFFLASGYFFSSNLFLIGQADMRNWFSSLPLLLMFFMPALAMRMLADEQRTGTFELLATMPLRTGEIVAGKFLAVLLQITLLLALTLTYPLTLALIGDLDVGQVSVSYIAALLMASSYAAMCLFASGITRYEVVAYVVGFGLLLAMFLVSQSLPLLPPAMQDTVMLLSPLAHYESMIRGMLALEDVLYFLSLTGLFLILTWFSLERRRWM
ncbi:MAG: hypothetical protein CO186_03400 [Zetaproteobacteria bacterium CG_4_9_14_3_um_filter_49_83]|nr:MAG: hypothetical protein AUJ56_00120 [Zetaproteobacteria bacterium CG1_02_49_23]PIQ32551.1 MAG: hypothetical protein COW62_07305 [Zetaproteobacteria bacterium CG17_big_fil_post_rev_8_21_14_2_50_50_13]PIV31140.1 MAG: hypothetical protein COS35_02940 [Zetaproteobacteria bacterium CG02_land_8_20_14_3_00_50_9]PIY56127.1 MAG: hypothetical protein COZ00_05795 [Zetaproteobacteria bacterium CG_4_10_14_0_8_um_filter_49_80]PJA35908.1 MAG: hypothetical protein CO186_03400 [Zetaproteobacteria bacterium